MAPRDTRKDVDIYAVVLFSVGIMLRFIVMTIGHNYDFDSYQIVGEIVSRGGSVYAETTRYNYGFIFFLIQGLGYSFSSHFSEVSADMFRVYIVSVLTLADMGIALYLLRKKDLKVSLLFFLNPIAIIITGYHNQFDNIAVLLTLLAVESIDDREAFSRRDNLSIVLFTLGLITKHIMAFFFVWMLINSNFPNIKKRIAYSCLPPVLFLLSFVPFAIHTAEARKGIINNVFLYRSYNNYPLLGELLRIASIPEKYYFFVFVITIVLLGFLSRKMSIQNGLLLYFVSLVAFSSAIANQYLVIPLAALALNDRKVFYWLYTAIGFVYCILNGNELNLAERFINKLPSATSLINALAAEGGLAVSLMTYVLLAFVIVFVLTEERRYRGE